MTREVHRDWVGNVHDRVRRKRSENDADGTLVVIGLAATEAKWGKLERQRQGVLEQSDVPYLQHEGPVRGSDTCRCGADVWKYGVVSRNSGAGAQTRTEDLLITNQLLYQLSYAGKAGRTRNVNTAQRRVPPAGGVVDPGAARLPECEV